MKNYENDFEDNYNSNKKIIWLLVTIKKYDNNAKFWDKVFLLFYNDSFISVFFAFTLFLTYFSHCTLQMFVKY